MVGGLPKSTEISEEVGRGSEGDIKDRSNGAVLGSNLQGGGAVSVIIWKRELGGDRRDAQVPGGVPPSGGVTDHGDDSETRDRWRVGVSRGRRGDELHGALPHWGIHQETADNHSGEIGLPDRLRTVSGGGEDARYDLDGALVGSRRGK